MQRGNLGRPPGVPDGRRASAASQSGAKLGMSQSSLSHTIRELEARLGVRLLTRTTRSVAPTQAGERLLQTIGSSLRRDRRGGRGGARPARKAGRHDPDHRDRIRGRRNLLPKLAKLLPKYPDIKVEIVVDYGLSNIVAEGTTPACAAANRSPRT